MSEQQQTTSTDTSTAKRDGPDDSEPMPERQAELRALYIWNMARGNPPYAHALIHNRGEVNWILQERGWMSSFRSNRGAIADFRQASFFDARLAGVELYFADLSNANLFGADLQRSRLREVDLRQANLFAANLSGAYLYAADLTGADLRTAKLDPYSVLANAKLQHALLADVVWNGCPLSRIKWARVRTLGDESVLRNDPVPAQQDSSISLNMAAVWKHNRSGDKQSHPGEPVPNLEELTDVLPPRPRRDIEGYRQASRAYIALAEALRQQAFLTVASRYRLRGQQLERHAVLLEGKPFAWLGSLILDGLCGYGERPSRALRIYAVVVLLFAALYFSFTNVILSVPTEYSTHLTWYEALVLSISSFHGPGFFPPGFGLGDPVAVIAAIEAVIGLFIEITFIATFTQRFFAR